MPLFASVIACGRFKSFTLYKDNPLKKGVLNRFIFNKHKTKKAGVYPALFNQININIQ